ncbi:MAG TPA: type VI secretion system tube protein Hcp [Terriglobales bacterium]
MVKLNGLSCTTAAGTNMFDALSWSWGASNQSTLGTGGGSGSGKASISELVVQKKFDACSPVLFGAVTSGKNFPGLTLTQEDGTGNILLTVTLTNVLVTSWQIGGSTRSELPAESVGFDFEKVCISDTTTGNKACFDKVTNTAL